MACSREKFSFTFTFISKEEILEFSGEYKLSVSVCFVSEHESCPTSTRAVGQVVTERDMCLHFSVDWDYVTGFLTIFCNNFAFVETFMVLRKKILLGLISRLLIMKFEPAHYLEHELKTR